MIGQTQGLVAFWLFVTAGNVAAQPPHDYAQTYHEPFRGQPQKAGDFILLGPDAGQCVTFEPEGLRITLPAGKDHAPTGVVTAFGVKGDFEITVHYEILAEPEPADAGAPTTGTRISLTVNLDRPLVADASLRRKVTPNQPVHILAYRSMRKNADEDVDNLGNTFPVMQKTGRFRLVRTGADIAYYLSEGLDKDFTLLTTHPFGSDDVRDVRIYGQTSSPKAALDVRFTDLQVSAAALPRKLVPTKTEKASDPAIPAKEYAQSYVQSFQKSDLKPDGWNYASRFSEQCMQFEPAGLRIMLPPGAGKGQSAGIVSAFGVKGDFEITLSFDVLKDPNPADVGKAGTRLSLAITLDSPLLDTPHSEVATLSRSMATKGFTTWMRNRERPASVMHLFPTPAMTGRLRLVRSGDELFYLGSIGVDQPFTFLKKYRFGAEDLKRVVITASTGGEKATLDVRVTDFRIRADAIPGAPDVIAERGGAVAPPVATPPRERGRGWLIAALTLAISISAALTLGFILMRKRRAAHPTEATPAFVSFACPQCAKAMKAKTDLTGKKVKCVQCGAAMHVPTSSEPAA